MRYLLLAVFIFLPPGVVPASGQPLKWTVIGTVGKWRKTERKEPVLIGMELVAGQQVERSDPASQTGSLTIIAGEKPRTFACDDPESLPDKAAGCSGPIAIPSAAPEEEGGVARLLRGVRQLIAHDSGRYYTAASRDTGSLADAVVQITSHATDLTPVVTGLSKGDYRVTVSKMTAAASDAQPPVALHWDPEAKRNALGPDLAPGLYRVSAQSGDGESAGEAWMLVVSPENYQAKSASFLALTKQTASWNADVPAATVRAVHHAALDELSR